MLVYGECECFVMQMLYVCVLCASCGSSQCCVLHDLQFVNAGRGCNRRPYRRGILQSRSHNCFIGSHECLLLFTPSCCGECFYTTIHTQSFCLDKTKQPLIKSRQNNLHSVHTRPCRIYEQSGPNNKQQSTTHGNAPKGSGSYLRPKTHIQHTHPQHLSTSTQTSTNLKSTGMLVCSSFLISVCMYCLLCRKLC